MKQDSAIHGGNVNLPNKWAANAGFERHILSDVTEHADIAKGWIINASQLGPGKYRALSETMTIGRVRIGRERASLAISQESYCPLTNFCVLFPIQSEDGWRVNGHQQPPNVLAYRGGGSDLLVSPGRNSDLIAVEIPEELLENPPAQMMSSRPLGVDDEVLREWLLCLLAQAGSGYRWQIDMLQALEDLLLLRITLAIARAPEFQTSLPAPSRSIDLLRRLEAELSKADEMAGSLTTVVRRLGLPYLDVVRSVEAAYGSRAKDWFRSFRLNGARSDLRRPNCAGVTEAAMRWGFFHLGRFGAIYRHHFGELPIATLKSARGGKAGLVPF